MAIAIERFVRTLTVHVVIAPPPSRVGNTFLLDDVRHQFVWKLLRCAGLFYGVPYLFVPHSLLCCAAAFFSSAVVMRSDCCFVIAPVVVLCARS